VALSIMEGLAPAVAVVLAHPAERTGRAIAKDREYQSFLLT
jgi:hypothetical protein